MRILKVKDVLYPLNLCVGKVKFICIKSYNLAEYNKSKLPKMRYRFILVRMIIMKKNLQTKC